LIEVDEWTNFTAHFTHLRNGEVVSDRALLLSAILADGINLGITRMAEACPGISASVLSRIATWHIREETYTKALAEIVNHHHQIEFAGTGVLAAPLHPTVNDSVPGVEVMLEGRLMLVMGPIPA
jgi:Tn3 transposase DDE domain